MKPEIRYIELDEKIKYLYVTIKNKTFLFINKKKTTPAATDIAKLYRK